MSRAVAICSLVTVVWLLAAPLPAVAYVGPGSGITVIGAALAFFGGIVLAIIGFVWYPVKRLMRAWSKNPATDRQS